MRDRVILILLLSFFPFILHAGFEDARVINFNEEVSSSFKSTTETHFYKIELPVDAEVSVKIAHDYVDTYYAFTVEVVNSANSLVQKLVSTGWKTEVTRAVSLPKGTYYLKATIDGSGLISVQYRLLVTYQEGNFEKEFNNNLSTATPILLNTWYKGRTQIDSDDLDFYRFELTKRGYFYVEFDHDYYQSTFKYFEISVLDLERKYVTFTSYGTELSKKVFLAVEPGTYYVKIFSDGLYDIPYSLRIFFTEHPYVEREPNNTYSLATEMIPNIPYQASIKDALDVDFFRFRVNRDSTKVSVNIKHEYENTTSKFIDVNVVDQTGTSYLQIRSYANTADTSKEVILNRGTYYLKVTSSNFLPVYELTLLCSDEGACGYYIYGTVKDGLQNPVGAAEVIAKDPETGEIRAKTYTDTYGNYRLYVESATYEIEAKKEGYYAISAAQTVTLNDENPAARTELTVSEISSPPNLYVFDLKQGWNLISIPDEPFLSSPEDVFWSLGNNLLVAWTYDNENKVWQKYRPRASKPTLDKVEGEKGYWLYVDKACSFGIVLSGKGSRKVNLFSGWNLVSYKDEERSVLDALYPLGNDWVIVWTWDDNQWYAKPHPLSGIDLPYPKIDKFKKGKAYWILMKPGSEAREWIQ